MKIVAIIPARGGSKRIPEKNIRRLGGKPLIHWTLDAALMVPEICNILVSTDDTKIAELSNRAGVLLPWLRPANLATDEASSVDVAIHSLNWYESNNGTVGGIILLKLTSPFRTVKTIQLGIDLFKKIILMQF